MNTPRWKISFSIDLQALYPVFFNYPYSAIFPIQMSIFQSLTLFEFTFLWGSANLMQSIPEKLLLQMVSNKNEKHWLPHYSYLNQQTEYICLPTKSKTNEIVKIHTSWYMYHKLAKISRYVNSKKRLNLFKMRFCSGFREMQPSLLIRSIRLQAATQIWAL